MSMDEVVNLFNRRGIAFRVWSRIIRGLDSDVPEEIKGHKALLAGGGF